MIYYFAIYIILLEEHAEIELKESCGCMERKAPFCFCRLVAVEEPSVFSV